MLELAKQKAAGVKLPTFQGRAFLELKSEYMPPAPSVQLIARDAFVADVAIRIDQLNIEIRNLSRELGIAKGDISALRDECERNFRISTFQESDRRTTSCRLESLSRRLDDIKIKVDHIRGGMSAEAESYNSFAAVSKKITELTAFEREFRAMTRRTQLSAYLFCGSVLMWLFTVLAT